MFIMTFPFVNTGNAAAPQNHAVCMSIESAGQLPRVKTATASAERQTHSGPRG